MYIEGVMKTLHPFGLQMDKHNVMKRLMLLQQ